MLGSHVAKQREVQFHKFLVETSAGLPQWINTLSGREPLYKDGTAVLSMLEILLHVGPIRMYRCSKQNLT